MNMPRAQRQRGFTLIELSIALLIGLFLIGGMLVMLQGNRRAFTSQTQLAQLQDNQRLAMTMITDVVQSAGYYPNPVANTAVSMLTAAAPLVAGQAIYGAANATASLGDKLTIRYTTSSGDMIPNCNGTTYGGGGTHMYTNEFSLAVTPLSSVPQPWPFASGSTWSLMCSVDGAVPVELVTGLSKMEVWYGVKRSATSNNSADTYLTVAQMAASDWANVMAIKVRLTFQNPLYIAGQAVPAATIPIERVIGVMNQNGVKL
jgi:type IV pilus assembly protein PilW